MRRVYMETGKDMKIVTVTSGPTTSISGEHLSFSIYEHQEPGVWALSCNAARFDHLEFHAKPHDIDHAKMTALRIIGERLEWLMRAHQRELNVMQRMIEAEYTKVDQPAPPELGSKE